MHVPLLLHGDRRQDRADLEVLTVIALRFNTMAEHPNHRHISSWIVSRVHFPGVNFHPNCGVILRHSVSKYMAKLTAYCAET
jgi:hypothetical protein